MIKGLNVQTITPSNTAYLSKYGYVYNNTSTSGTINILPMERADSDTSTDGTSVVIPAGGIFPVLVKKVFSTGTTGTFLLITEL
jgi:hypothetical protein